MRIVVFGLVTKLGCLSWFGHYVKMSEEKYRRVACNLEHRQRNSKKDPDRAGKNGYKKFWRKEELKWKE